MPSKCFSLFFSLAILVALVEGIVGNTYFNYFDFGPAVQMRLKSHLNFALGTILLCGVKLY